MEAAWFALGILTAIVIEFVLCIVYALKKRGDK